MKTLLESIRLDPFLQELFTSTKTSGPKYITGKDDAPWQAEDHFQLKDWSHQFHFSFFSQTKTSRLMYIAGKEAGPCAMRMAEDHLKLIDGSHQSWLAVVCITSAPRAVAATCSHQIIFQKIEPYLGFSVIFSRVIIPAVSPQVSCTPRTKSTWNTPVI